jgi:two-component system response regulator DesR
MLTVMLPQFAPEPDAPQITVFIAARHERVRAALWQLLAGEPRVEPLASAADFPDLIRLLERVTPAVVIVEHSVLGDAGLDALASLTQAAPHAAFIVVGMNDHPGYVRWAREAGAADYVPLDEAADRLGPSVVAAWESEASSGAARRTAGIRAI